VNPSAWAPYEVDLTAQSPKDGISCGLPTSPRILKNYGFEHVAELALKGSPEPIAVAKDVA